MTGIEIFVFLYSVECHITAAHKTLTYIPFISTFGHDIKMWHNVQQLLIYAISVHIIFVQQRISIFYNNLQSQSTA